MSKGQRKMLWRRIRSRVKGLAAMILAVMMVVGLMPAMEVQAADVEKYYFVQYSREYDGYPIYFGKGDVTGLVTSDYTEGFNAGTGGLYYTGLYGANNGKYVYFDSGSQSWTDKCKAELIKIRTYSIGDSDTLDVSSDTTLYYGTNFQSGGMIIILNGTELPVGQKQGNHKSTSLPAGKYKIERKASGSGLNSHIYIDSIIDAISLSKTEMTLTIGASQKITVTPQGAEVEWSTSDDGVASVDEEGNVTAKGVGKATITAALKSDSSVTAACQVTVNSDSDPEQTVSENARILVVKNKSSITKLFSKYGESGYKYKFRVEDKAQRKIASVTRKGKIRVKKSGKVKVSLFRKVKGGAWSKIEEQEIKTEKPIVKPKVTDLKVGDTLEASSFITNQKDLVNKPTSYVSTNTKVATVESKTGKIKILKKGSTKIKMIYGAEKGAAVYKTRLKVNQ